MNKRRRKTRRRQVRFLSWGHQSFANEALRTKNKKRNATYRQHLLFGNIAQQQRNSSMCDADCFTFAILFSTIEKSQSSAFLLNFYFLLYHGHYVTIAGGIVLPSIILEFVLFCFITVNLVPFDECGSNIYNRQWERHEATKENNNNKLYKRNRCRSSE